MKAKRAQVLIAGTLVALAVPAGHAQAAFVAPPKPTPPALPWAASVPQVGRSLYTPPIPPPPNVGPRVRFRKTVPQGSFAVVPRVNGRIRIICTAPSMGSSGFWMQGDPSGGTQVHRYDGGRTYDLIYRVIKGGSYSAREKC